LLRPLFLSIVSHNQEERGYEPKAPGGTESGREAVDEKTRQTVSHLGSAERSPYKIKQQMETTAAWKLQP
jgi:hypothetical protein